MDNPNILIISNNVMCECDNNGQTLLSLFHEFTAENVSQLYFSSDDPSDVKFSRFFRISDYDILCKFLRKKRTCGGQAMPTITIKRPAVKNNRLKRLAIAQLMREYVWRKRWMSKQLDAWILEKKLDIIFFVAGDCLFAYDICKYIRHKTKAKQITFYTDDYVSKRVCLSIFWWIKRTLLQARMKNCLNETDRLLTISNEMKCEYKSKFGVDSVVYSNVNEVANKEAIIPENNPLRLIYAGTLEHKRYKTLCKIVEAIHQYNKEKEKTAAYLEIFSSESNAKLLKRLAKHRDSCKFRGFINKQELSKVYEESDVLVYAEAFDYKARRKIRLSVSTKVLDYLAYAKPILAVGPKEVSSMRVLSDVAVCSFNTSSIKRSVYELLNSKEMRKEKGKQAKEKFERDYKHMQSGFLKSVIKNMSLLL